MSLTYKRKRKAFTLIELLIVIAIIGILFIVLVSKVDFATDKAKMTGVQTDFRSFQVAFDSVAKEYAGFNTFGYDTGDVSDDALWNGKTTPSGQAYTYTNKDKDIGDKIRNSYDVGDANLNGELDPDETWTGRKFYTETWTNIYTHVKPGTIGYDTDALFELETAINKNLDPKLHITIAEDGTITMANQAMDPWDTEYHGVYITNALNDQMDRGAIIMYSNGPNKIFKSVVNIVNGVVKISNPGNSVQGQDDLSIVSCYTFANGYGEVLNMTTGFSNNQSFGVSGNDSVIDSPSEPSEPSEPGLLTLEAGLYETGSNYQTMLYSWQDLIDLGYIDCDRVVDGMEEMIAGDLVFRNTTLVPSSAFQDCVNLTGVVLPDTVTTLNLYSFYRCTSLKSVTLGNGIDTIPTSCFSGCSSLVEINLDNVKHIQNYGLSKCGFESVVLPSTIESIGNNAFAFCASLISADLSRVTVQTMGNQVFYSCENLETVKLPPRLISIPDDTFAYDSKLRSVIIPNTITKIGKNAFFQCRALTTISLPLGVTEIGDAAFRGCRNLSNINLPNSINTIGVSAFAWTKLESVVIPTSMTVINANAFTEIDSLKSITIHKNVTSIESAAFAYDYDLEEIVFLGTMAEWTNIAKASNWDAESGSNNGSSRYSIKCINGTICFG